MEIGSSAAPDLSVDVPPASEHAQLEVDEASTQLIRQEYLTAGAPFDLTSSHACDETAESPSTMRASHFSRKKSSAEQPDQDIVSCGDSELVENLETEVVNCDESIVASDRFVSLYTDDGHSAEVESPVHLLPIGKPVRNKKLNTDARHQAVFDVISSLLDLAGGAEVQKKFLADVCLLSELTSFLDRPASTRLILTWGHLSVTDVSGRSAEQSSGNKRKKVSENSTTLNVSRQAEIDVSDSWMIYKEEVPVFLSTFLYFLRIFCIFGVVEPADPLQFITLSAIEKGAKILEVALGCSLDLSQFFMNSRSVGFGSSQRVHYCTMDAFCNWVVSLNKANELSSIWRAQARSNSPSASPSRKITQADEHADADRTLPQYTDGGNALVPARSSDEAFQIAEERLLYIASNRAQCLVSWNELQEFSDALPGPIEITKVDRWIVNLFPMLDFSPALRRAFRRLKQNRRQQKNCKPKEQQGSKSPQVQNNDNSLMIQEFAPMLNLVVYYRRIYCCIAGELQEWDDDELEDGLGHGINSECFSRILKRLHAMCLSLRGSAVFQASPLAAVTSLDFISVPVELRQLNATSTQSSGSRSISPPSRKVHARDNCQTEDLRSIGAVLKFFEDKDARSMLTYSVRSSKKVDEEKTLHSCMSAALQKSADYIDSLVCEEAVLPDNVFETSASLGSECLNMKLFDELLKDMFPTVYLRSVLFASYKHVHANRMHQKHLAIFDSSSRSLFPKFVYFCKLKNVSITSASMIMDGDFVFFGVIASDAIQSTISFINDLWRPVFDLDRSAWGSLDYERMQEFFRARASTTDLLHQVVREGSSGIKLSFPDDSLDIDRIPVHRDAVNLELQGILIAMVASWCDQIDAALVHNEPFFHDSNFSPSEEILYWTTRFDVLSGIEEQLKARERRHCVMLIGIVENKPANAIVKRFRTAEKALLDNLTEALDTKSHLMPLKSIACAFQHFSIRDIADNVPQLMELISLLALRCRRYGPGLPISSFIGKFSSSIERCIIVHLHDKFGNSSGMFWSRPISENMVRLVQSIACIDQYQEGVNACRAHIHVQQVNVHSQAYSAASKAPLPSAIQEIVACQNLVEFKQALLNLRSALSWQSLFANCFDLRNVSTLKFDFDNFDFASQKLVSMEVDDLFNVHSNRLSLVMKSMIVAKDALFDSCLRYINVEIQAQETVGSKIDVLDLYKEILEQAGPAAKAMVESHSIVIVQEFMEELQKVKTCYEAQKHRPPTSRAGTPVFSAVAWARMLALRISQPMKRCSALQTYLHDDSELRRCSRLYTKITKTLIAFENMWLTAWRENLGPVMSSLRATLLTLHPTTSVVTVNLDSELVCLIREAKSLVRLGIDLPNSCEQLILQEHRLKHYHNELQLIAGKLQNSREKAPKMWMKLLQGQFDEVMERLQPALKGLTWESLNIDSFISHVRQGLDQLDDRVSKINQLSETVLEQNLRQISSMTLVRLPVNRHFSLKYFVQLQEESIRKGFTLLNEKSTEMERVLTDLIEENRTLANLTHVHSKSDMLQEEREVELEEVVETIMISYERKCYSAVLACIKRSMADLRRRMCSSSGSGTFMIDQPLFQVDVELCVPSVIINPSLDDVQSAIDKCAVQIIRGTQQLAPWKFIIGSRNDGKEDHSNDLPMNLKSNLSNYPRHLSGLTFYERIANDMEMVKNVLILTGAVQTLRNRVGSFLGTFASFEELWLKDKKNILAKFQQSKPSLVDFETIMGYYRGQEKNVAQILPICSIGCLNLQTEALKNSLKSEVSVWQAMYARSLIEMSFQKVSKITNYMSEMETLTQTPLDSINIERMRALTSSIQDLYDFDANFAIEIQPLSDGLQLLEQFEHSNFNDDTSLFNVQCQRWRQLQSNARVFEATLMKHRPRLLLAVQEDAQKLSFEAMQAKSRMESHGPFSKSKDDPEVSVARMLQLTRDLTDLVHRAQNCNVNEKLLQAPCTQFPNISHMMAIMRQVEPVYHLYMKAKSLEKLACEIPVSKLTFAVTNIVHVYHSMRYSEALVDSSVQTIHVWTAYEQLLLPWVHALPVLEKLQSPALRPRHWMLIMETIKSNMPQSNSNIIPFGLEKTRVETSMNALDDFLFAVRACANEDSTLSASELSAKMSAVTSNELSKMTSLSLMCLICCLPVSCLGDLCQFPRIAEKEIQVEQVIETVASCLSDTMLSTFQLPNLVIVSRDSDDIRIVSVAALQQAINVAHDCRMQLLLLKQHPHGKVFFNNIDETLGVVINAGSCLELLKNVQDVWLRSRSFILMMGSQTNQLLKPGDVRVLVDNQKLMTRITAQIQVTPNILDACGTSSLIPKTLPIMWQNLESLTNSISSMLFDYRLKLPELFVLSDDEASEILSMGCNICCLDGATQTIFCKTFKMFPSVEGIFVKVACSTSYELQTVEMLTDNNEGLMLIGHSSVCDTAVDTLSNTISAVKSYISACHSNALQELLKQTTLKVDHRVAETSQRWIWNLLNTAPVQSLLLAIWTFFTDLVESALQHISTFTSPAASCDELFLETARFLSLCSREITKTIHLEGCNKKSHLEILLTGLMSLDETVKGLRERVCTGQCTGLRDFDWFCHFRYYYNTSRGSGPGNMIVEAAGVARPYTFQPASAVDAVAIPMVPFSARVAVAIVSAVSGFMIPMLVGPAGEGKCTIVRSVAAWLGQPYILIDACCNESAAMRCSHAVAGGGYWGIITNAHHFCSKVRISETSSAQLSDILDQSTLAMSAFASQISLIIRTLSESHRNGRVGASIMVHGTALLLRTSAAFVICTRSTYTCSLKPFSCYLRNLTRTVFVKNPSSELIFTIALRVSVGLPGSRCRDLANQLELLANCSSSFGETFEGLPGFSKNIFVACTLAAAKMASSESDFFAKLILEVQKRTSPVSFSNYMDAHKAVFAGVHTHAVNDDDALLATKSPEKASLSEHLAIASEIDIYQKVSDNISDLHAVVGSVGLKPNPRFCENVVKLSFNIECCRNVMIVGRPGSGRSSVISTAIALLKARRLRANAHFVIMPQAQTRTQLFGTFDTANEGIWLKGLFQHMIGVSLNFTYDMQHPISSQTNDHRVEFVRGTCKHRPRLCLELDCGLDGECLDLLVPTLKGQSMLLNDGSSIQTYPNAMFILKGSSFEKCSPTLLNLVTVISCSACDLEIRDVLECCIRRSSHPLKEHVLKVAIALLEPCITSPPPSVVNPKHYRHHTILFFNAIMARILAHDDAIRDSEKHDSYAMIGDVTAVDMERFTAFACLWAAGAQVDSEVRIDVSNRMRINDSSGWFSAEIGPNKNLYDYFPVCDVENGGHWVEWSAALPTGVAMHNILSQTSQNFNRSHPALSPCLRRVYIPTKQSVAMAFLCDLLLPHSVLLFGNSSSGCSSFAMHYALLCKGNPHAHSNAAIFRMSGMSSFDSFLRFIDKQCNVPLSDDPSLYAFASCILVIDDVHLSMTSPTTESGDVGSIREIVRSLVHHRHLSMPIYSIEQSRLRKSNGNSFLLQSSGHIRILATAKRSSMNEPSHEGLGAINFAKLLWTDANGEMIRHIFKTTISFQTLHIQSSVSKSFLDALTSATMQIMLIIRKKGIMSDPFSVSNSDDLAQIQFVTVGEEVVKCSKKGRSGSSQKWLKIEACAMNEGSRLLLTVGSKDSDSLSNQFVISSVHIGVPHKWEKEETSLNFYFNLDKTDPLVFESERAADWVSGVNLLFANLKSLRERVHEEWKYDVAEKLPLGVTFDLRRLGILMASFSAQCASSLHADVDELWRRWRTSLLHAFSLEHLAIDHLQNAIDAAIRDYSPVFGFSNSQSCESQSSGHFQFQPTQPSLSQSISKRSESSETSLRAVLMQFPSVSSEHLQLLMKCPSVFEFTESMKTMLNCRCTIVECAAIDATSSAVVTYACESLGYSTFHFSTFERSEQLLVTGNQASFKTTSKSVENEVAIRALHACLRMCVKCVCLEQKPSVFVMTASEMFLLKNSLRIIFQVLDDGDCTELFTTSELSALALDAEEAIDYGKKSLFSSTLIQKLRVAKNARAVEELHDYDHVVPLFGLGRDAVSSVSFFLGSTAARGRISLGKNASGGNARLEAVLRARTTHDIKFLVLAEPESSSAICPRKKSLERLIQGDFVSTKLPLLSKSQIFKEMLSSISQLDVFNFNTCKILKECVPQQCEVLEALQKNYDCAISHFAAVDSCIAYHFLLQFKFLYEIKLLEIEKTIQDSKMLENIEEQERQLVELYRTQEVKLREEREDAKSQMERLLKDIVVHSGNLSRKQQKWSTYAENSDVRQESEGPYVSDANDAQISEDSVSILKHQISNTHDDLDSKMTHFQNIHSELSVLESSISRLSSVFTELRTWKDTYFVGKDHSFAANEHASTYDQTGSLAWHCASLAAFSSFGGLKHGQDRINLLRSFEGMGSFLCSKTSNTYRTVNASNSQSYEYVNAVADDATQLLWQQCGIPEHPELFLSISLVLVSIRPPFVYDKTGILLEFLNNMSWCDHSESYDNDAPIPPPEFGSHSHTAGALVRSTKNFPAFVQQCPAAATWTDSGRQPAAGCVVVTLPIVNDDIEMVISACTEGQLLVLRIPAQATHASAAMQSLITFVPLFLIPKKRKETQTVYLQGHVLILNARFTCVVVNESDLRPSSHVAPLLSSVHFSPGLDAMEQILLRSFVTRNSLGLMTSLCVMTQRLLCSVVQNDSFKNNLLVDLNDFSSFIGSSRNGSNCEGNEHVYSAQGMTFLSANLNKIEKHLECIAQTKASLSRAQSLMLQLNTSLLELLPYTLQYQPSMALAAVSSAANLSASNMFQAFFMLLKSSFDETLIINSSNHRKSVKTSSSSEASAAAHVFRQLCALIPMKHRLSVALYALKEWMGGDNGLRLLVNAPLPPSSPVRKSSKLPNFTSVPIQVTNATTGSVATTKLQGNPLKKSAKGSTSNVAVVTSGVIIPEVAPSPHPCPTWMPIDKYATLSKYAAETKSPGLRFAEEEMLRDEGSEWRSWFISDSGPILPPCPDSSCSVLEKLAIVQLLRPDRFTAAVVASVVSAHPSVDAGSLLNYNRFDIPGAVVASQRSRTIIVIQEDNSDSVGDLFAHSEKHMGYSPLLLSATFHPSDSVTAEFARAQRVGGWVVLQIFHAILPSDVQWIQNMMSKSADIQANVGIGSTAFSDEARNSVMHSQFRLWIICSSASFVPPKFLQSAHVLIHESPSHSFALTAVAAVEAASIIRDDLSPKCSVALRSHITVTALFHALLSFKSACSASLSLGSYDPFASLPAMRVQISQLLAFSRSSVAIRSQVNRLSAAQIGSLQTPKSQSCGQGFGQSSLLCNSAVGNEWDVINFLQLLCGGCGLLMGCCDPEQRRRLESLAESVYRGCGTDVTSSSMASLLSLPIDSILAAETCDIRASANSTPLADLDCSVLGPDVLRVLRMQKSSRTISEVALLSSVLQKTEYMQDSNTVSLQNETTERLMTWLEHSAPHRPNILDDFVWTDPEAQNNIQNDSEATGTIIKPMPSTTYSGISDADTKLKQIRPNTPATEFKAQTAFQTVNPIRPAVNAVFLTLYEILLALPETIDSNSLSSALHQNTVVQNSERQLYRDKEFTTEDNSSKVVFSNHSSSFLTLSFATFLMKELRQWNGVLFHIRQTASSTIDAMKNATYEGEIVDSLRRGATPWIWKVSSCIRANSVVRWVQELRDRVNRVREWISMALSSGRGIVPTNLETLGCAFTGIFNLGNILCVEEFLAALRLELSCRHMLKSSGLHRRDAVAADENYQGSPYRSQLQKMHQQFLLPHSFDFHALPTPWENVDSVPAEHAAISGALGCIFIVGSSLGGGGGSAQQPLKPLPILALSLCPAVDDVPIFKFEAPSNAVVSKGALAAIQQLQAFHKSYSTAWGKRHQVLPLLHLPLADLFDRNGANQTLKTPLPELGIKVHLSRDAAIGGDIAMAGAAVFSHSHVMAALPGSTVTANVDEAECSGSVNATITHGPTEPTEPSVKSKSKKK